MFSALFLSSQTPGPAAYKAVDPSTYMQNPPHFSMTGRNFTPGDLTKKPGPGAHYPERVRETQMIVIHNEKSLVFC